jgi:hypothetical protein
MTLEGQGGWAAASQGAISASDKEAHRDGNVRPGRARLASRVHQGSSRSTSEVSIGANRETYRAMEMRRAIARAAGDARQRGLPR